MKFHKILVTGFDKSALDEAVWKKINATSDSIVFEPQADVDCLLSKFNKVDKAMIDSLPKLKYIGVLATEQLTLNTLKPKRSLYVIFQDTLLNQLPSMCLV